ncbi:TraM recognition domain-containing protein [Paraburkholderia sp. C35]|uniref:TraM recognition domain-containing protein n=1 Tax=Paraburkholderia sp. C35 TaxID=2126993 RepID=UPI000D687C3B|nr:TraM recognition domain-containing protein [Paraburkholderia sp. C35]
MTNETNTAIDTTLTDTPFARAFRKDLVKIRDERHTRDQEYFTYHLGVPENLRDKVPYDLRDAEPSYSITYNNTPLQSFIKTGAGDDDEVGHGGSSLVESLVFYFHPILTLASMLAIALLALLPDSIFGLGISLVRSFVGLGIFLGVQALYARGTIALYGRNWNYIMRATVKPAVAVAVAQVVLAALLPPSWAAPLLMLGNAIILARPFLEGLHVSRGLSQRMMMEVKYVGKPNFNEYRKNRNDQILATSNLAKNGPFITFGYATGKMREWGNPYSPDAWMPMGASIDDLTKHTAGYGNPGMGKTVGMGLPVVQQIMAFGSIGADGKWRNCAGIFAMDGKGELGADVIATARKMGLEKVGVELIEIGIEAGCDEIAPIEGLTATDVASSLAEMNKTGKNGNPFFDNSAFKFVLTGAVLLEGLRDREIEWMDAKAQKIAYVDPETGATVYFRDRAHLVEMHEAEGWDLPVGFVRQFVWTYENLMRFCKQYVMDQAFLLGVNAPDGTPKSPAGVPTVPDRGGAVGWLQGLSYYANRHAQQTALNRKALADEQDAIRRGDLDEAEWIRSRNERGQGLMLDDAINVVTKDLLLIDGKTVGDITATVASWMDIATGHPALRTWLNKETGADVTACMRGAVVAMSLSKAEHGVPGAFFIDLAKRRFFRTMLTRPGNWRSDIKQRPVLILVDEAADFVGAGPGGNGATPEMEILAKARSKGALAYYLTQNISQYEDNLGVHGALAFAGNFNSFFSFLSTKETLEWARDRIGKYANIKFSWSAKLVAKSLHSMNTTGDVAAMERQHQQTIFKKTYPADVVLSKSDIKELEDEANKAHTGLHMNLHLLRMFTTDLVLKMPLTVWGAVKADTSLVAKAVSRLYHGILREDGVKSLAMGETKAHVPEFTAKTEGQSKDERGAVTTDPILNADRLEFLKGRFLAVASFNRGGIMREDIVRSIGSLDFVEQGPTESDEAFAVRKKNAFHDHVQLLAARQPGVITCYDVIDQGIAYASTK